MAKKYLTKAQNIQYIYKRDFFKYPKWQPFFYCLTIDFSWSDFSAGNCCPRRQVLLKRARKAVRRTDGSLEGISQNLSEIIPIFTMTTIYLKINVNICKHIFYLYSYLGMENQARGKIFRVVFEAALIFLQCGTHLKHQNQTYIFQALALMTSSNIFFIVSGSHFSKSKADGSDAHKKAWQLEHLSISQPTLIQPYLAHIRGERTRGLAAHFAQCNAKENIPQKLNKWFITAPVMEKSAKPYIICKGVKGYGIGFHSWKETFFVCCFTGCLSITFNFLNRRISLSSEIHKKNLSSWLAYTLYKL